MDKLFNKKYFLIGLFSLLYLPSDAQTPYYDLKSDKWGVKNNGRIAVKPQYDFIGVFRDGKAQITLNKKQGYIDETGREIIHPKYWAIYEFNQGLAIFINHINGTQIYQWGVVKDSIYTIYNSCPVCYYRRNNLLLDKHTAWREYHF